MPPPSDHETPDPGSVESVRKRPAMYLGTDQRGLQQMVGEVVSNAVDQFAAGNATQIAVNVSENRVTVTDNGGGYPLDTPEAATRWLTQFHDTASASNHAPHIHVHGRLGVGLMPVAALSEHFQIRSQREGRGLTIVAQRGRIVDGPRPDPSFLAAGTEVAFTPDPEIFGDIRIDTEQFTNLLSTAAYLLPGLKLSIQGREYCAPRGLEEYVRTIESEAIADAVAESIRQQVRGAKRKVQRPAREHINPITIDPVFWFHARVDEIEIQAAVGGQTPSCTTWRTWCNGGRTAQDGTHREGLSYALRGVGWKPVVAAIHVVMFDPRYAGPTRGTLNVPEIRTRISRALRDPLHEFASTHQLGKYS